MMVQQLAAAVKLLILDVDGVLTDGRIYLHHDANGAVQEMKVFHARDGHGIKLLQKAGVDIAVISGRESPLVTARMNALGVTQIFQGCRDKKIVFEKLIEEIQLKPEECAYLGDDTIDLCVMNQLALPCAVQDAHPDVLAAAKYITERPGGCGAVREVCDLIIAAKALAK